MPNVPTLAAVFRPDPHRRGLRGDAQLWHTIERLAAAVPLPTDGDALSAHVHAEFVRHTGRALTPGDPFFVKGLDHGGMSGGMVTPAWWLVTALPLLRARLAAAAKPPT
jgi:hypothetical protein